MERRLCAPYREGPVLTRREVRRSNRRRLKEFHRRVGSGFWDKHRQKVRTVMVCAVLLAMMIATLWSRVTQGPDVRLDTLEGIYSLPGH